MTDYVVVDELNRIWIMIYGQRRRVVTLELYHELFELEPVKIETSLLDRIESGPDICSGSCLIRGDGSLGIFLVTGYPGTSRHLISDFETFQAYGFRLDAVRNVPVLVLEQVSLGGSIYLNK